MSEVISQPTLRDQIAALGVDESVCVAKRLLQDKTTSQHIAKTAESLHNRVRSAIARATEMTGHTYTGETGEWRTTRGHNPVICFLVTRIS